MKTALFLEIVDDSQAQWQLRLFDGNTAQLLTDETLHVALENDPKNRPIFLLDSLFISARVFTQPVKDKAILSQVIAADLSEFLQIDSENLCIAHQRFAGETWVSWIERSRIAQLEKRFATIAPRIKGLVPAPLLLMAASHADSQTRHNTRHNTLWSLAPLVYGIHQGQSIVMREANAKTWLHNLSTPPEVVDISEQLSEAFQLNNALQLPNLWQAKAEDKRDFQLPILSWAAFFTLTLTLWVVNTFLDYTATKDRGDALLALQLDTLNSVFPNADTTDPFGRLRAEFQHSQLRQAQHLPAIFTAISQTNVTVSALDIDLQQNLLRLRSNDDASLQARLNNAFSDKPYNVEQTPDWVAVSW